MRASWLFLEMAVDVCCSLLCHCVPPWRKHLNSNKQKNNRHSDEGRTRPVVFIGDEKKEKTKHTGNNIVAKQKNEKRTLHGQCKPRN